MEMLIAAAAEAAKKFRKELHRNPEIAGKEFKTCAAIRQELAKLPGVEVLPPFLETDTVAIIDTGKPGKLLTFRADIDALHNTEETGVDFASTVPGMMHACGHDVHTAILLGTMQVLSACKENFSGRIQAVFQPGEENLAMAKPLIAAGALKAAGTPDFVAAIHCEPGMAVGSIGVRTGAMMSSCQHFHITFHGKSGHGSRPHAAKSPLLAACSAVMELQTIVGNRINSQRPAVVSVCAINSGKMDNVVPETAEIKGTLRALDDETAILLGKALRQVCNGIAAIHDVSCEIISELGYLPTVNSASGADTARRAIAASGAKLVEFSESSMASEDFSYFIGAAKDGAYAKLGVGEECTALHNSKFMPGEDAIAVGIKYFCALAGDILR